MTTIIYFIPIVIAIFIFIFFRTKVVWWEYLIVIVPTLLLTLIISTVMIHSRTQATEYFGDYVTEAHDYEFWDEWITETCSRTVDDGNGKSHSESYDCSHRDDHPEHWTQVLSNGKEQEISKDEYYKLLKSWNARKIFVDMNRDFYNNDGNMYNIKWDNNIYSSKTITTEHSYTNKINSSYSIFGFSKISKKVAKEDGLYDYPNLYSNNDGSNGMFSSGSGTNDQSPFLGYKPTLKELKSWQYINGYYGQKNQIRVFLMFYYNKSRSIVKEQQSYWLGGNKNELVLCFGLDSISKNIQWVDAFSWSDKPTFEVNFRSYYNGKTKLNLEELANWTESNIPKYWQRKQFKDFEYIDVDLSSAQQIWLFIIILIVSLGLSVYLILNNYYYDKNGRVVDENNKWNNYRY